MTDVETLERLKRIVRVFQEGRYSVIYATQRTTGRQLVVFCENQEWGNQLGQVTPLAVLDPLPGRSLLVPTVSGEQRPRPECN